MLKLLADCKINYNSFMKYSVNMYVHEPISTTYRSSCFRAGGLGAGVLPAPLMSGAG